VHWTGDIKNAFQRRASFWTLVAVVAALLCSAAPGFAATLLGTAQSSTILGHETVTNCHSDPNPNTQIFGNLAFALTGAVAGTDNLASDNCAIQNFGSGTSESAASASAAVPAPPRSRALYACATVCGLWRRHGVRADSPRRFVAPQRRMID
jgi:hypothetical protein